MSTRHSLTDPYPVNVHPLCDGLPDVKDDFVPYPVIVINLVLIVFGILQVVIGNSLFLYYRDDYEELRKRNFRVCATVSIGVLIQLVSGPLTTTTAVPSFYHLWLTLHVPPFFALPPSFVFLDFAIRYSFAKFATGKGLLSENDAVPEREGVFQRTLIAINVIRSNGNGKNSATTIPASPKIPALKDESIHVSLDTLRTLKTWSTFRYQFFFALILMSPMSLLAIANYVTFPEFAPVANCWHVLGFSFNTPFLFGMSVFYILTIIFGAYICRSLPDPFQMLSQIRWYAFWGTGLMISYGLTTSVSTSFISLQTVFTFAMQSTMVDYQVYKALRYGTKTKGNHQHGSTNTNVVVSGAPDIESPGRNAWESDPEFENYLASEFSSELLKFLHETNRFEAEFADQTDATRRVRAKRIKKLYVDQGAVLEVNLPFDVRSDISKKIDAEDSLQPTLFHVAKREVRLMLDGVYSRYKKKNPFSVHRIPSKQSLRA